jgi:hypothetical protein
MRVLLVMAIAVLLSGCSSLYGGVAIGHTGHNLAAKHP